LFDDKVIRSVNQITKGHLLVPHYLFSPLKYYKPGSPTFMQILRLYIAPDLNFNRIGLSIKEKLSLHDIWTDKTDTISTISF